MRIYVNRKPVAGPWGGGSKVLAACIDAFKRAGHCVIHTLEPDIDVIFCFDPRQGSEFDLFSFEKLHDFSRVQKKRPLIVQRVGDIGSHGKPELNDLIQAASFHSDAVIFPSAWAYRNIRCAFEMRGIQPICQWYVIPNAPLSIFQRAKSVKNSIPDNVSFVTHHWSTNPMKGFGFYAVFKRWCVDNGHKFTFIGREPAKELGALPPMTEIELAVELPKHDVYVTASLAEAGANHVLEAMAVGLPVIYHRDGGSIVEYCSHAGIPFDGSIESFEDALSSLRLQYPRIKKNIQQYRQTVEDAALLYVAVIDGLLTHAYD